MFFLQGAPAVNGIIDMNVRVRLYWSESESESESNIFSRRAHRESNLMFIMISNKDKKWILLSVNEP